MRAWAEFDPEAFQTVQKVFQKRLDFARTMFSQIGLTGDELEIRARLFVCYHSWERAMFGKSDNKKSNKMLKLCHSFLTKK